MKITKFGHCCLLIEAKKLRILTDLGNYNATPEAENVDMTEGSVQDFDAFIR